MNTDGAETVTFTLHRLTSNTPAGPWYEHIEDPRLLRDFTSNDPTRRTAPAKQYDRALPRIRLPRQLPVTTAPALAVLAGTATPEPAPLDLAALSRLLHLSAGVVRTAQIGERTHLFRAAGSAGGRFPLELYLAVPHQPADGSAGEALLPPGVHWYDPVEHALVTVGPAPETADRSSYAPTIIVTGVPWRTGWRYRERGFRHVYWDAGTMLSQLLALADSVGLAPRLYTRFPDKNVSALIGAEQVHEWPVALVTLGDGTPAIGPTDQATAVGIVDADPLEFPLVTAAQRAGDTDELGQPWDMPPAVETPIEPPSSPSLDAVIARRGSQRRMDADRGLPLETLRACMALALRGIAIEHFVAVHNVSGLAPGIYRWPDLDEPVRATSEADMRDELRQVCLDQMLAHDAAFVVISSADATRLSDREYREAQLAAGIAEGRLHLAAYALDASATGMTFNDHTIPELLDGQAHKSSDQPRHGLLFTCVGVPANTSKPAGPPGAPTLVRIVAPRT